MLCGRQGTSIRAVIYDEKRLKVCWILADFMGRTCAIEQGGATAGEFALLRRCASKGSAGGDDGWRGNLLGDAAGHKQYLQSLMATAGLCRNIAVAPNLARRKCQHPARAAKVPDEVLALEFPVDQLDFLVDPVLDAVDPLILRLLVAPDCG